MLKLATRVIFALEIRSKTQPRSTVDRLSRYDAFTEAFKCFQVGLFIIIGHGHPPKRQPH